MESIKNQYVVTSEGIDKNGKNYSMANKLIVMKDNKGSFLSSTDKIKLDDRRPIGTMLNAEMKVS